MTPSAQRLEPIAIDAANGIGAMKLAYIRQNLAKYLQIEIFNNGTKGQLNDKVNLKRFCSFRLTIVHLNKLSVAQIMLKYIRKHLTECL